jgi:hypothetical protein
MIDLLDAVCEGTKRHVGASLMRLSSPAKTVYLMLVKIKKLSGLDTYTIQHPFSGINIMNGFNTYETIDSRSSQGGNVQYTV